MKAMSRHYLHTEREHLGGPRALAQNLCEMLQEGNIKPEQLSLRDLAEFTIEDGAEWLRWIDPRRKSGRFGFMEASLSAVDTSGFSNITGQLIFSRVKEGYEYPQLLWPDLCETVTTEFIDGERIPGIGGIGDETQLVGEGEPFPYVGLNEEYIDTPPTEKRGFILGVTREMIIADRTGLLTQRAGDGGKFLSINKEKRVIDVATGIVNNYKRNGTASNTYLTSGAYINQQANTLVDWTDLENAELLYDAMTDPNTGEPIMLNPNNMALLVPSALKRTAMRVVEATQLRFNDGASNTTAAYTPVTGGLPGRGAAGILNDYKVLSNAYVKLRTSSATTWFTGDFKGAIKYMQVWGIDQMQMGSGTEADFTHDVSMRWRVTERGVASMWEPRKLTKNT